MQEFSGTKPPNIVIQDLKDPRNVLLNVFSVQQEFKNGFIHANDRPGWGVAFDAAFAFKFSCEHEITTWTQRGLRHARLNTP